MFTDEQKKLKSEAVVTQDKKKLIYKLTGKKNFEIRTFQSFNSLSVEFLNEFSNELKKYKNIYKYPDLVYLLFWCNKKKIEEMSKNFLKEEIRLGRGLIFHICPSNVPTNFIYSFFFGLLSGNSNIVKLPSKNFHEKKIILLSIKKLFKKKKYNILNKTNCFIEYDNKNENTKNISSACDGRVIWGGDKTINQIRKIWIPERAVEITFSDRYSISILNLNEIKKCTIKEIKILANKFFYDGYSMNQLACNSPHFVFWVGAKNIKLQNSFWNELNNIVEKKFSFDDIHVVDKYSNLIENIINQDNFNNLKVFKNNLYVINPNNKIKFIDNIRGVNGTFFQKNVDTINHLKQFITKKCQTVSYFGFNKKELKAFLLNNNFLGIDRIVPIGKALGIDIVWDGYDVIKSLSRVVTLE